MKRNQGLTQHEIHWLRVKGYKSMLDQGVISVTEARDAIFSLRASLQSLSIIRDGDRAKVESTEFITAMLLAWKEVLGEGQNADMFLHRRDL